MFLSDRKVEFMYWYNIFNHAILMFRMKVILIKIGPDTLSLIDYSSFIRTWIDNIFLFNFQHISLFSMVLYIILVVMVKVYLVVITGIHLF